MFLCCVRSEELNTDVTIVPSPRAGEEVVKSASSGGAVKVTKEWPDGAVYEGEWLNGKANGKGTFTHPGEGVYTHADGSTYTGQWVNDKQHGKGVEAWPDG